MKKRQSVLGRVWSNWNSPPQTDGRSVIVITLGKTGNRSPIPAPWPSHSAPKRNPCVWSPKDQKTRARYVNNGPKLETTQMPIGVKWIKRDIVT